MSISGQATGTINTVVQPVEGVLTSSRSQARMSLKPPVSYARKQRWTASDLRAEESRLTSWVESRKQLKLGVPAAKTRPSEPSTSVIAREANVRRSAISSETGHLRQKLKKAINEIGLQPFDEPGGLRPDHTDRVRARLESYIADRKADGLGLPSTDRHVNMAAVARGAGIGRDTLLNKQHPNHELVMREFKEMGGSTEETKRSGPLVLAELMQALQA